ncbi:hypothetical protein JCM16774_1019 [Pseudoleptotrichia goodfellowii]|uniref:Uncharacterized protein n=1 Tax=Pseudoleptotrichia goodfellowii TaxID=157692 RepID=A0A510JA64_9FUSO|nr:hypothetical protein JCM16774_1019 [Pseudoleptotrichia goodfellowii]
MVLFPYYLRRAVFRNTGIFLKTEIFYILAIQKSNSKIKKALTRENKSDRIKNDLWVILK